MTLRVKMATEITNTSTAQDVEIDGVVISAEEFKTIVKWIPNREDAWKLFDAIVAIAKRHAEVSCTSCFGTGCPRCMR